MIRQALLAAALGLFCWPALTQPAICQGVEQDTVMKHFFGADVDLSSPITKTLTRQFRDQTNKSFPDPALIQTAKIQIPALLEIRGATLQMGFYPGAYRYDVKNENGVAVIEVRTQLKDGTQAEHAAIRLRLQQAENIWNAGRPQYGFRYKFRFLIADSKDEALFHVHVKANTHGPYFKNWDTGSLWTATSQAHEIGHMLGLTDEYEIFGKDHCTRQSLWCSCFHGQILPFDYYFILRRVVMQASGCEVKSSF